MSTSTSHESEAGSQHRRNRPRLSRPHTKSPAIRSTTHHRLHDYLKMSNGRAQSGGNGAGPSAFSMYASRFLNGNGRETAVEGSQVSISPHRLSLFPVVLNCPIYCRWMIAAWTLNHSRPNITADVRYSALHHPAHPLTTLSSLLHPVLNPTLTSAADPAHHPWPVHHHSQVLESTRFLISIPTYPRAVGSVLASYSVVSRILPPFNLGPSRDLNIKGKERERET